MTMSFDTKFYGNIRSTRCLLKLLVATALSSGMAGPVHAQSTPAADQAKSPDDIIVTAGRREQSVIDVPYNISAIDADTLTRAGANTVNDVIRLVPGLVQAEQGPALYGSGNNIVMRGLNAQGTAVNGTQQTVSPVATYFGDVAVFFPLSLTDIDRVEVLRGPQGTLYGSGAAGGAIRFIPKTPQLGKTSIDVGSSLGITEHASRPNYSFDGVLNLPVGSRAALRVVGGYQRMAGFIDAVGLVQTQDGSPLSAPIPRVAGDPNSGLVLASEKDTNNSTSWFVRGTLRWEATDALSFDLSYHHQYGKADDSQRSNPFWTGQSIDYSARNFPGSLGFNRRGLVGGGRYANGSTFIPSGGDYTSTRYFKEPNERKVDLVSLDSSYDLGFATVTSTTSYFDNSVDFLTDNTTAYTNVSNPNGGLPLVSYYAYYPRLTAPTYQTRRNKTFTEEVRLASSGKNTIDYVLGGYYSQDRQHDTLDQYIPGYTAYAAATRAFHANPTLGDESWKTDRRINFNDKAVFGELTWHVTPRWQFTGGTRFFWQSFANTYYQAFPICGSDCGDGQAANQALGTSFVSQKSAFHDHVVKLNTSYDLAFGAKIYATYSEGFRRGGANTVGTSGYFASLPTFATFKPDLAKNYEIGLKGRVSRVLSYSATVFQIDWSNFQFEALTPSALPAVFNGDKARSRGVEVEFSGRLTDQFSFTAGYSYIDAKLTKAFQIYDLPQYGLSSNAAPIVAISGPKGAPLPGSAKHTATVSLDYVMPVPGLPHDWQLGLNLNAAYRSSVLPGFPSASQFYYRIPPTAIGNARVSIAQKQGLSFDLSVDNISNTLARSSGPPAIYTGPYSNANIARPRTYTIGARFSM